MFQHKYLSQTERLEHIKNIPNKDISENTRDVTWLIGEGRLAVRRVVKCYVTTKTRPIETCQENETIEHLLIHCSRTAKIWKEMTIVRLKVTLNEKSIRFGIFAETLVINPNNQ